ncbi:MAG: hypothetical protein C0514_08075 [Candidatus Puniceispirillum sp.]|nr:hypothetical protein [Candidatus Puniceispirillum sp.]
MRLFLLVSLFILSQCPAKAGVAHDLGSFFDKMGGAVNATDEGAYTDQTAGYYTGGGIYVRNGARNIQPMTLQMPSFRAGCGGIDLHLGGMSFVSGQELVSALRAIGSNAASYAFMLGLQTMSPQIYNVVSELNALAQKINQMNINSCEVAATAIGGVWPQSDMASKHLCTTMAGNLGAVSDWAKARQNCGADGKRDETLNRAKEDPKYKDMLVGEYNLAWRAIQKNGFLAQDTELAEFFMTLSGSLISRKTGAGDEAPLSVSYLASLADHGDLINALLSGGSAKIWKCDTTTEDGCLKPTAQQVTITNPLERRVSDLLDSMVQKVYDDTKLSNVEIAFLNSTSLPIYKILNVSTAYQRGRAPIDIRDYAKTIAYDLLSQYLLDILDIITANVNELRSVQVEESHIRRLLDGIHRVRERVFARKSSAMQNLQAVLGLIEKSSLLESQIFSNLALTTPEKN